MVDLVAHALSPKRSSFYSVSTSVALGRKYVALNIGDQTKDVDHCETVSALTTKEKRSSHCAWTCFERFACGQNKAKDLERHDAQDLMIPTTVAKLASKSSSDLAD